ncbi:two-component system response regulator [Aureispira sp. CCB-QB1]|uniref:response regulator n=1 Tax=Aureispira sp. CCB-QB1 TaxID=1313421 RepID=UPI00069689D6|nr:response regulator [Aureispira sp. CCB-QB1]
MLDEIILIDDDKIVTTINKKIVQKLLPNASIKTFENGEAGLIYLITAQDSNLKTLVFLDIDMPIMDGFQFLNIYENAMAHQDHSFVICLLTSSIAEEDQKKAAKFLSVLEYAQKPLDEATIQGLIERAVTKLRQQKPH